MTTENWIEIIKIIVDLIKTAFPFIILFFIFWVFKKEIKELIRKGGLKVTGPGFSLETLLQQQSKSAIKKKKEIAILNTEVETPRKAEKKLHDIQDYTKSDTFSLGYHFEKTYRLIFPSQMVILSALKNREAEIPEDFAIRIFNKTIWAQQFNLTFAQFIGFLTQNGLITNSAKQISLTPLGKTFMEYLMTNNIPLKIPATDQIKNG